MKELTTGVQQLVRLLFNNNFVNPGLVFQSLWSGKIYVYEYSRKFCENNFLPKRHNATF